MEPEWPETGVDVSPESIPKSRISTQFERSRRQWQERQRPPPTLKFPGDGVILRAIVALISRPRRMDEMATDPQSGVESNAVAPVRLERIRIENYKGIDRFELDFPNPRLPSEHDMFALGSRNGLGKTSILEALALCSFSTCVDSSDLSSKEVQATLGFSTDRLIRFDTKRSKLEATFSHQGRSFDVTVHMKRGSRSALLLSGSASDLTRRVRGEDEYDGFDTVGDHRSDLRSLFALNSQPFLLGSFAYFHSYRRLAPAPEERSVPSSGGFETNPYSFDTFKSAVYELLLARSDLYEETKPEEVEQEYRQLHQLLEKFAGVQLGKLRQADGGRPTIRVESIQQKESFPIDGLSSGQKSIISTLYLIWKMSRERPGLVLIDEPELHMNPEWHREFMAELQELAAENQYVMATHSRDVFSYFDEDKRIRLGGEVGTHGDVD